LSDSHCSNKKNKKKKKKMSATVQEGGNVYSVSDPYEHDIGLSRICAPRQEADENGKSSGPRRRVSFGEVKVLEFPIELGDNPFVSKGAPLTIGWEILETTRYELESFEQSRMTDQRRSGKALRIPNKERTQILLNQGYTEEEIELSRLRCSRNQKTECHNRKFDNLYATLVRAGHRVASKRSYQAYDQRTTRM
jgi:hypothetical protein